MQSTLKSLHDANGKPERRPRILAVDDQRDSVRILQIRLESAGFECFTAPDGAAALDFLDREAVDLVILDVIMPKMDGYEVCRRIKSNEATRDIPVLFLTAKLDVEDKVRGLEAGGHDYLSKPIEQSELLARTRAALRVKQLQDEFKGKLLLQEKINRLHQGMLSEHWQKTLGQLAASLAHEINNPLTVALANVQLLTMQDEVPVEAKDRLGIVATSLQRVGQKLRSLLLITKANSHPQVISLAQILEDLLTLVNVQVVMEKVAVRTQFDRECTWNGPPGDLACALLYILNNAIEAMSGRTNSVISIQVSQQDGKRFIRISDNGVGIPSAIQHQIFEPFFTTKSAPHYGVGLFLANNQISQFGGRISFESVPGEHTEFTIELP